MDGEMTKEDYDRKVKHSHSYQRSASHIPHIEYSHVGDYTWVSCTGCRWFYEPTKYEKENADPMLNVLLYHHRLHVVDIVAKTT